MGSKSIVGTLLFFLAINGFLASQDTCEIKLILPKKRVNLSREVKVKVSVSPLSLAKEIESEKLHLYFFQHNTLESKDIWHFNFKPSVTDENILTGKLWLGGQHQGKNEDYVFLAIISKENKEFRTGEDNTDVVAASDLPRAYCQKKFSLQRSK